ncbi:MAG: hypothetical protein ACI9SQ_002051 [Rubritalea sp.]|jgi:hypothetical protein
MQENHDNSKVCVNYYKSSSVMYLRQEADRYLLFVLGFFCVCVDCFLLLTAARCSRDGLRLEASDTVIGRKYV